MKRSKRLAVVVELTRREEDTAADKLRAGLQTLEQHQQRLNEIERYYGDYEKLFNQNLQPMSVGSLQNNREFLKKLSESRSAQHEHIKLAQSHVQALKEQWRTCHLKAKNLKKYVTEVEAQEINELNAKEQKLVDDWSTQFHSRR